MPETTYGIAFSKAEWHLIVEALQHKLRQAHDMGLATYVEDECLVRNRIEVMLEKLTKE